MIPLICHLAPVNLHSRPNKSSHASLFRTSHTLDKRSQWRQNQPRMLTHAQVQANELRKLCQNIIHQVMGLENAGFFFRPVNPQLDGAPDYFRYITQPMSIFEVQEKIDNNEYATFEQFVSDMRQIWQNAQIFNNSSHQIHKAAERISRQFEVMIASAPHNISFGAKSSALQRAVEVRFAAYRAQRRSHQ